MASDCLASCIQRGAADGHVGVLAHEAVHRVLFKSVFWNEFWGGLLSAFALIPFNANRQFHLTHHSYAHQPGLDPENAQHEHSFIYAATVGSALALNAQYVLLLQNLKRLGDMGAMQFALFARDVACLGLRLLDLFWLAAGSRDIDMAYDHTDNTVVSTGVCFSCDVRSLRHSADFARQLATSRRA